MKLFKYLPFLFLLFIVITSACKQKSPAIDENIKSEKVDMMIGVKEINDFKQVPHKEWFDKEFISYEVDSSSLSIEIIDFLNIEVLVYFGSWCSDSRREVPRFLKIMNTLNFNSDNIKFIGLDREKSAPNYKENIWDIQLVPTFIFLQEDNEIGRIIETPQETLEKDISNILSKG